MFGGRVKWKPKQPSNKSRAMIVGGLIFCTVIFPLLPALIAPLIFIATVYFGIKATIWFFK